MFLQAASSNALHVLKDILIRFLLNLVLINNQLIAGAKLERQGPPRRGGRQVVLLLQSYSFQSYFVSCGFVDRHLHTPSGNGETFPRHDDRRRESRHEGQESHASRDTSSDECSSARSTQRVYIRIFSIESIYIQLSTEIPGIIFRQQDLFIIYSPRVRVDDGSWPLSKLMTVLVSQRWICIDSLRS